jgi:hypothetical protein
MAKRAGRRVVRASLATLTVAASLGMAGCGAADVKTADGRSLTDVDKFLDAATATWQQTLTAGTANTAKGAACFVGSTGGTVNGVIFCGPVLHQFGDPAKSWDTYAVTVNGGDEPGLTLAEEDPDEGVALPAGVTLMNPNKDVPSTDGLTVPPPPVLDDPQGVQVLDSDVPITGSKAPADGRLRTPDHGLTVDRVATPAVIGTGSDQRRAPDGQQLYVVALTLDPQRIPESTTSGSETPTRRLTLISGDTRRDLGDIVTGQSFTLAFAAAAGQTVALELSDSSLTQTFDLVQLKRTGPSPDVLYRAAKYPIEADVNVAHTVRYSRLRGDGSIDHDLMTNKQVKGQIELGIDKAALVYRQGSVQAKAPDRALLAVDGEVTFTDGIGEGGWGLTSVPLNKISLTLPDKSVLHPRHVDDTDGLFGGTLVFDVPASFTTGTFTITPGRIRSSSSAVGGIIWNFTGTYSYPVAIQ